MKQKRLQKSKMKQELMNSSHLQYRWRQIVGVTCYAVRCTNIIVGVVNDVVDSYTKIWSLLIELSEPILEPLVLNYETFAEHMYKELIPILELIDDVEQPIESYPQSYPRKVDNLKTNTKGFPRPINKCARSRCK